MNGNGYALIEDDEMELLDDLDAMDYDEDDVFEVFEDDEEDEDLAERRRRRRPRRRSAPRTARGKYSGIRRPSSRYVTQIQLQTALAKVSTDVRTNGVAIKKVNGRVNTLSSEQGRQAAALKKEIKERKDENAKLKNNIQMATLLPLLTKKSLSATTAADTVGGVPVPAGTRLATEGDGLSSLLPILLLSGSGGSGGLGGGDDSNMLLLVLALSGSLGK